MHVFLANAPWSKPGFYGVRAGSRWPHFERAGTKYMPFPFFLGHAAALLRDNEIEVGLCDAIAERIDDAAFYQRLAEAKPDLLVFEVSSASFSADKRHLAKAREILGEGVKIVFVGPFVEMFREQFLTDQPEVDFVLVGEYEFSLLGLASALKEGLTDLSHVPGLIWRKDGTPVKNAAYELEKDLDKLPWPARDLLPMANYWDCPGSIPEPSLQVIASRGCPFGCIFCAWPQFMYGGTSYRTRSPKDVADEIRHCVDTFGYKSFYFDDDTFNIGKKRILELCQELKARDLHTLPWAIMARADQMDAEMLHALKDAGLTALKYGVESGSQEVLKTACKGLDLEKVRETVKLTRELGIRYHLTFMFGLPGETWETARATIDLAKELNPDSLQFSIATPFPGSKLHSMLVESGRLASTNLDDYDGYSTAVAATEALTPEELMQVHRMAEEEWAEHCRKRAA